MLWTALVCVTPPALCGADPRPECPGATAWEEAHPDQSAQAIAERDKARTLSDPQLLAELQRRVDSDQAARRGLLHAPQDARATGLVQQMDAQNIAWLRRALEKGFPTAAQVGEPGVHLTWILLQHADSAPQLQQQWLPTLVARYQSHELPANDLARYVDRLLRAAKKPQRFGTQFDWQSGTFSLPERQILEEIEANRRQLGLMPLEDYACKMIRVAREAASGD
jgi:hypothetical protein